MCPVPVNAAFQPSGPQEGRSVPPSSEHDSAANHRGRTHHALGRRRRQSAGQEGQDGEEAGWAGDGRPG